MSSQSVKQIKTNRRSSSALSDEAPKVTQAMLDKARFRVGLQDVPRKQRVNIMLDTGVIAAFKAQAGDRGYQTLINEALKQHLHQQDLEDLLRKVVREELTHTH
jgi:uncharacterized protein (DUF4415 family)